MTVTKQKGMFRVRFIRDAAGRRRYAMMRRVDERGWIRVKVSMADRMLANGSAPPYRKTHGHD
jgi:hypothetical protein